MSRSLIALMSRFGVVGMLATLIYLIVSNLLILTGMVPTAASVFGYLAGMAASFIGQSKFTFQIKGMRQHHLVRFCILSFLGLALSYATVRGAAIAGAPPALGTAATAVLIPLLSFGMMKLWVFRATG